MKVGPVYFTDGKGNWWKREWGKQCQHKVFIHGQCQGVKGHQGVHWLYSKAGWFDWERNKKDLKCKDVFGACGSIPPGHKRYMTPEKMIDKHCFSHFITTKVINARKISQLEKGTCEDGASIDRPVKT